MAAEWQNFAVADLFPQEMADAIDQVQSTADTLGAALDIAASIMDLVGTFVSSTADLNEAIIDSMQALIDSLIQQLLGTGVYMLTHIPDTFALRVNPQRWLVEVSYSLNDVFDPNVPLLVDPFAYVGGLVVLGVGPDFRELMKQFRALFELFGALIASIEQLDDIVLPGETPTVIPSGVGKAPNWESITVAKLVPGIGTIVEQLRSFSQFIEKAKRGNELYERFGNLLRNKANALRAIADAIQQALDDIAAALDVAGAYILPIYGQMDKRTLQAVLLTSEGGPLDLGDNQFAAGFMFLAQGGTTAPRDVLFDLFGVAKQETAELQALKDRVAEIEGDIGELIP